MPHSTKYMQGDDNAVYAFTRQKAGKKMLVILNFSAKPQTISLTGSGLAGNINSAFGHARVLLSAKPRTMGAWGYEVYVY